MNWILFIHLDLSLTINQGNMNTSTITSFKNACTFHCIFQAFQSKQSSYGLFTIGLHCLIKYIGAYATNNMVHHYAHYNAPVLYTFMLILIIFPSVLGIGMMLLKYI